MSVARKLKAQPQTKTYHATMLVSVDIVDHQKAIWALAPLLNMGLTSLLTVHPGH